MTPPPPSADGNAPSVCLPPVAQLRRVPIVANPRAGNSNAIGIIDELVRRLADFGLEPELHWRLESLAELTSSTLRPRVRCIVSAGGDGTLLEVLNRAPGVPVTILPLGNENLVARFCGIARSGPAVAQIVQRGRLRTIDLARCNGRLFSVMAGVGFDAEVVHRVHQLRTGHIDKSNWVLPIVRTLAGYRYPELQIEIDDTGEILTGATAFVFNIPRYAMDLPLAPDADPCDGLLDLRVFPRGGRLNLGRYMLAVLRRRHDRLPDLQRRRARRIRISSAQDVPVQTDGDPSGHLPITMEVVPRAATLVVP